VDVPVPTAVTGTLTLVVLAAIVVVDGTVAAAVLLEDSVTAMAEDDAVERFRVRLPLVPTVTVSVLGEKLIVVPTVTGVGVELV
jgi:hypothetical protein